MESRAVDYQYPLNRLIGLIGLIEFFALDRI